MDWKAKWQFPARSLASGWIKPRHSHLVCSFNHFINTLDLRKFSTKTILCLGRISGQFYVIFRMSPKCSPPNIFPPPRSPHVLEAPGDLFEDKVTKVTIKEARTDPKSSPLRQIQLTTATTS